MKILSLCCGAGGIDEGLKQAGFKTTLAVDYDPKRPTYSKTCLKTINANHPDTETLWGNILDYEKSFGKYDMVVGGVPCPEFSNAKTDKTYDDTLVKCFWRIVNNTGARYWLLENVPGIIKVCKLRNFLINCADYGTPQKRIRRFYTNLERPSKSHMENPQMDLFGIQKKKWVSVREALGLKGLMVDSKFQHWKRPKSGYYSTDNPIKTIDTQPQEIFIEDRKTTFGEKYKKADGEFRKYPITEPSFTVVTDHRIWITKNGFDGQNGKELSKSVDEPSPTILTGDDFKLTNYKLYSKKYVEEKNQSYDSRNYFHEADSPARTILSKDLGVTPNMMVADSNYARKLTNEEYAILQGFPKDYIFEGTKTEVKRQIGNAVPAQPVKALFSQLHKILN